jgi:hypothetical protein
MVLLAVLLPQSGCNLSFEQDPATTVTVEITGVDNDSDRENIQETLKEMTDGSSHMMTSSSFGDTMTVSLSPVEDAEAFSKKINFGKVTEVDGRTIKVEFVK